MERREHPRFNVVLQVRIASGTHSTAMETGNVSESGLFLQTEDPEFLEGVVPLSTVHLVLLDIESLETIDISGTVVRIVRGPELRSPGVAVRYDPMPDELRARVRQFIRRARERAGATE